MDLMQVNTRDDGLIFGFVESLIGGRAENQDNLGWTMTPLGFVVTVCDGMGGGPGGATASTIAVREIIDGICHGDAGGDAMRVVEEAVQRANRVVHAEGCANECLRGMGSTATVLLINERAAYVAHVGDSRVYQLRGGRKVFRTFDHSMVFERVRNGEMTEEEARLSPRSNVITRALGIYPEVLVDVVELRYKRGDRFLLCTDGVHGALPEAELLAMTVGESDALGGIVDGIAKSVDGMGHEHGGMHDNLTLALLETTRAARRRWMWW